MDILDGSVHLGGVRAADIAARFGTPLYVMDAAQIARRYRRIVDGVAYPALSVHYACKANPNVQLMRFIRSLGASLDACSPGDLAFGTAAGFEPRRISYTSHSMTDDEMRLVAERGVFFNADSLSQVERYGRLRPGTQIGLRINPGVMAGFHVHVQAAATDSKFGIQPAQLDDALALAQRSGLEVIGVHCHIGSDVLDASVPLRALEVLVPLARRLPSLRFINVGGGWGVPYAPEEPELDLDAYGAAARPLLDELSAFHRRTIELRMEPGSYLTCDAGYLLTKVTEIKEPVQLDGCSTPRFAGIDSSFNHVVAVVIYDAFRTITLAEGEASAPMLPYHIAGNLMQGADILARDRLLPELQPGALLVIGNCGAYAASRAPTFNSRPRPAEVLVEGGAMRLIRRAETLADLLAQQVL